MWGKHPLRPLSQERGINPFVILGLVFALVFLSASAVWASHPPDPPDWVSDFGEPGEFGDDDCAEVILLGDPVLFYGIPYDSFWVNSNGNVTFDDCNTQYWALAENFAASLMAAPLLGDWDPSEGGAVYLNILGDGTVVVTWELVPEYFPGGDANTFQMAIYPDGTIRFSYQHLETDGLNWTSIDDVPEEMIVGVSSGTLVVAEGEEIPLLEGSSLYLCWGGEEYFLASDLSCAAAPPELNRYHPWVTHSTLGHLGLDKVGVWGYFEGHWADQFEFFEVTHEGGHVAWVGMPDGDYKAVYRWCENGEVREYWDHFSFGGATDIVGPTINLAEVEYTVVGPCGAPDADP